MKKTKEIKYPDNVITDAAKRLFDQGIILPKEVVAIERDSKRQIRLAAAKAIIMKGYQFNAFSNRKSRRESARNGGYFERNTDGGNGWHIFRAVNNVQTVHKSEL